MNANAVHFTPTSNSGQNAKKNRSKKDASATCKDPKEVEIDFLKRELNIAKTHLLAHESEVKDLKRKNKILEESIAIFENNKQSEMSNRYTNTSSTSQSCAPPQPCSHSSPQSSTQSQGSPSQCSSHSAPLCQSSLQPDLISKLLNLLSDLLIRQSSEANTNASPTKTAPQPPLSTPSVPSPPKNDQETATVPPTPNIADQSLSDSVNTLDEFATELSQESFSGSFPEHVDEQAGASLNGEDLTTQ